MIKFSTNSKLIGIFILSSILMMIAAFICYNDAEDSLYSLKKSKIKALVENTTSIIESFLQQEKSGEITREQLQKKVASLINNLRYDQSEYFWITDLQSKIIVYPTKSYLENQDLSEVKDSHNRKVFAESAAIVSKHNEGFITYYWPIQGNNNPAEGLMFIKLIPELNWIIGTSSSNNDINIILQKIIFKSTICIVILSLIQASLLYLVAKDNNQSQLVTGEKIPDITENNIIHSDYNSDLTSTILEIKNTSSNLKELISSINNDHITPKATSKTTEALDNLLESAGEFINIIDNIQDIEEQINLLAINSSIEASKPVIKENGLRIIAEEMTSLSRQINNLSGNAKVKIEYLQKCIWGLDDLLNNGPKTLVKSHDPMTEITKYLDKISTLIAKIS